MTISTTPRPPAWVFGKIVLGGVSYTRPQLRRHLAWIVSQTPLGESIHGCHNTFLTDIVRTHRDAEALMGDGIVQFQRCDHDWPGEFVCLRLDGKTRGFNVRHALGWTPNEIGEDGKAKRKRKREEEETSDGAAPVDPGQDGGRDAHLPARRVRGVSGVRTDDPDRADA